MEKLKELELEDEFGTYYDGEIVHEKKMNSARSDVEKKVLIMKKSIAKTMLRVGESINKVMEYTSL